MYVYIISSPSPLNRCKVGKHSGTVSDLVSRFITDIPDVCVDYFIKTAHAKYIEDTFKTSYRQYRFINSRDNLSEWVTLSVEDTFSLLAPIILKCHGEMVGNTIMID